MIILHFWICNNWCCSNEKKHVSNKDQWCCNKTSFFYFTLEWLTMIYKILITWFYNICFMKIMTYMKFFYTFCCNTFSLHVITRNYCSNQWFTPEFVVRNNLQQKYFPSDCFYFMSSVHHRSLLGTTPTAYINIITYKNWEVHHC